MYSWVLGLLAFLAFELSVFSAGAVSEKAKQEALDEWKQLTAPNADPPRVFIKDLTARFYFQGTNDLHLFTANWRLDRAPTDKYRVNAGKLRPRRSTPLPSENDPAWKSARIIFGPEAEKITVELRSRLTPSEPGHGFSYEALFADRTLYRDAQGNPAIAFQKDARDGIIIDHHFFPGESLEIISRQLDAILAAAYPNESLFVLMAPGASHFVQPLLVDRKNRQCVCFSLGALFDSTERGASLKVAADGFSALVLEGHCLALVKNPVSSIGRLADALIQDSIRLVRFPRFGSGKPTIPASPTGGMDLTKWEQWLDRHTGTKLEQGSLRILRDGDEFFGRLRESIVRATNHISANVYIFDRDDVGIEIADLLKQRSSEVPAKVTYDRLCSVIGPQFPKLTAMPRDYVPPSFISSYLKKDSQVQVRPLLNPWISVSHSKLFLVDGNRAWIGGMNLGREYMHEWHDFMVEIEGPVVGSFENEFNRVWAQAGPWGDIGGAVAALHEPAPASSPAIQGEAVRVASSGAVAIPPSWSQVRRLPTSKGLRKPFKTAVLASFDQARDCIYIENGYLFDHGIVESLIRARKRGVDVRVILPRLNNFTAGIRSNLATAERLRQHGIRVYLWPGMTHAKALLVDGWACLGSANLNEWSLRLTMEENIATSDPAFAEQLKTKAFESDFARSFELTKPIEVNLTDHVVDGILSY